MKQKKKKRPSTEEDWVNARNKNARDLTYFAASALGFLRAKQFADAEESLVYAIENCKAQEEFCALTTTDTGNTPNPFPHPSKKKYYKCDKCEAKGPTK